MYLESAILLGFCYQIELINDYFSGFHYIYIDTIWRDAAHAILSFWKMQLYHPALAVKNTWFGVIIKQFELYFS